MLLYDLTHWMTFVTAALLLVVAPGPDIAFILGQTLKSGRRAGYVAVAGVLSGAFAHVVFAVIGLSAVIMASATAFTILKYAGAAYLVWIGVQAFRGAVGASSALKTKGTPALPLFKIFRQGFLIDLLNPKAALFFLAFLPQFVAPGAGPVPLQLFVHGVLIIVIAAMIEPFIVIGGAWLANGVRARPRLLSAIDRGLGGMLIFLGVRLAMTER